MSVSAMLGASSFVSKVICRGSAFIGWPGGVGHAGSPRSDMAAVNGFYENRAADIRDPLVASSSHQWRLNAQSVKLPQYDVHFL